MVSFAGSEWSFAQLRLEHNTHVDEFTNLTAIVKEGKVYALTSKGWLIKAPLNEAGGSLAAEAAQKLVEET